jgi:HAD superfamily phosphatase (TIGR01681 family)
MSKVFAFKVAIFDLDDTLWNGKKLFDDTKLILSTLRSSGVKMYIASYHTDAATCCKQLGISSYFEDILYGRNKTKLDMITYIIKKNPSVNPKEMVFFDDNSENVNEIRMNTDVHVIHIGSTGIGWECIANGKIATVPVVDENLNVTKGYIKGSSMYDQLDIIDNEPLNGMEVDVLTDDFHLSDMARFSRMWMRTITI